MKETAFKNRISTWLVKNTESELDVVTFIDSKLSMVEELVSCYLRHMELKMSWVLRCVYSKTVDGEEAQKEMTFKTSNVPITNVSEFPEVARGFQEKLLKEVEDFQEKDSGWSLEAIVELEVRLNNYNPMRGSSFIDLPPKIKAKKAIINVQNNDQACFKWAVLSALHPVDRTENANRTKTYEAFQDELDFTDIAFPTPLGHIKIFERKNNIAINVYALSDALDVYPLQISACEYEREIDLLLLEKAGGQHYCWVKNLSRLASAQHSKHEHSKFICKRCLTFFSRVDILFTHMSLCNSKRPVGVKMPENPILAFKNVQHGIKAPFTCYADFECITEKISTCLPDPSTSSTTAYQKHRPVSFCYFITYDCGYYKPPVVYRGTDAAREFMVRMAQEAREIHDIYKKNVPMERLSQAMLDEHEAAQKCYLCLKPFSNDRDGKVRDHSHVTGQYRGAAHNSCNLLCRNPSFLPILFHNLSGYDAHLFVKEMGFEEGDVSLIPNNEERYISLSKKIEGGVDLRFLDSCRFMMSSLDALAKNLSPDQFVHVRNHFPVEQVDLLLRKGVFPYDFFDSMEKCGNPCLPPKQDFYSELSESTISDQDYEHAQRVWDSFQMQSFGEYVDLYVKTDVLILADVFENFRSVCMKTYCLDPVWYFTSPGLSWDAMLKATQVQITLLQDYDMLMFVEEGIRGGLSQCSRKYAKANNPYVCGYDPQESTNFLTYFDVNNLYGWAMCQPLPLRDFEWCEPIDVMKIPENTSTGYILEVDLRYPESLHNHHADLPLAPENRIPDGGREKRLLATLYDKVKYVVHYKNLQQYVRLGVEIVKVHRAIKFHQEAWLEPYISKNTELRKKAANEFEKDFYKLMNNSIFGKTMENVRRRVDIRLCTNDRQLEKLISKPNFERRTIYAEELAAVHLKRCRVIFNKPITIGMAILDLSKTVMYEFHYEYMKVRYPTVKLLYTDTDSFIYDVETPDIYADMKADLHRFDTSDYDPDNPYGMPLANKKIIGLMKDETRGRPMLEFVGLRSKMYAYRTQDAPDVKKLKGVKKSTVTSKISFDEYKACLFRDQSTHAQFNLIRSVKHELYSVRINKLALCNRDQKRHCVIGRTETLPWGHVDIRNKN